MAVIVAVAEPELPSAMLTLPIESATGASSSVMVPTPWPSASVTPPDTTARLARNVSSISSVVSPFTFTTTVLLVSPGAKVRVVMTVP